MAVSGLVFRSASCIGSSVKQSENLFAKNTSGSNILYHIFFFLTNAGKRAIKINHMLMHPLKTNANLEKREVESNSCVTCVHWYS